MAPAAPATVALDPVAVARAGHAATRRAAAKAHRVTLRAAPAPALAPAPAPRLVFTPAVLLEKKRRDTVWIQFFGISWMM